MGFLERAIRNGISKGVGDAIGKAVQKAVEPKATEFVNKTAASLDEATQNTSHQAQESSSFFGGFEGALANLQRSAENYATEAAKNIKICPACDEPNTAEDTFCRKCGAKLPEATAAQGAVCSNCGKQNTVGTKFCSGCGTKLPAAVEQEQAELARGEEVLSRWDNELAAYPKWSCGGVPVDIERLDTNEYIFTVDFKGDSFAAKQAVRDYLQLARQHGFHPAGMYPSNDNLYNRINGVCYYLDTEHAFDGDSDCPCIAFAVREPAGGYDYVKPEPKPKASIFDLFK